MRETIRDDTTEEDEEVPEPPTSRCDHPYCMMAVKAKQDPVSSDSSDDDDDDQEDYEEEIDEGEEEETELEDDDDEMADWECAPDTSACAAEPPAPPASGRGRGRSTASESGNAEHHRIDTPKRHRRP